MYTTAAKVVERPRSPWTQSHIPTRPVPAMKKARATSAVPIGATCGHVLASIGDLTDETRLAKVRPSTAKVVISRPVSPTRRSLAQSLAEKVKQVHEGEEARLQQVRRDILDSSRPAVREDSAKVKNGSVQEILKEKQTPKMPIKSTLAESTLGESSSSSKVQAPVSGSNRGGSRC